MGFLGRLLGSERNAFKSKSNCVINSTVNMSAGLNLGLVVFSVYMSEVVVKLVATHSANNMVLTRNWFRNDFLILRLFF
jgi:hypothetical protein